MTAISELAPPELLASIQGAAQADPAFLNAFFVNPKSAYQQRFGVELLPGYEVKVEQSADGAATFSVPGVTGVIVTHISPTDELSDDELEFVSAGSVTCKNGL
jgi:hypothetical protein